MPAPTVVSTGLSIDPHADIRARLEMAEQALSCIGQKLSPHVAELDIAVLLPCYNEAATIRRVVEDFRAALPQARIYVYDNNSQDTTADEARRAGAVVRRERLQGKGHVVRRMFADIEADIYVMADGDATYDAAAAPRMVTRLIDQNADMVVGGRITEEKAAYRPGHRWGNKALTGTVSAVFGDHFTDMLSGYRVLSRRFVKSFPALSSGFEIETELTVHALELGMSTSEVQTTYFARPSGSVSKLNTIRDGARIAATIGRLVRDERPLAFFGGLAAAGVALAIGLALPLVLEFAQTGLVPRFPTAFLAASIGVASLLSLAAGVILETVSLGRREIKRLAYNQIESLAAKLERLQEAHSWLEQARSGPRGARHERTAQDLTRPMQKAG